MSSKAKTLARRLLRENKHGRSWRTISREDYNGNVNHATLNRIANSKGEWLPKDEGLLMTLGLKRERKAKATKAYTPIAEMSINALRKALRERTEMPPVAPAFIKEFQRQGWIKKEKRTRK